MKKIVFLIYLISISVLTTAFYHTFKSEWINFRKAERLYENQEYLSAIPMYHSVLKKSVNKQFVLFRLGDTYNKLGMANEAIGIYRTILNTNPGNRTARIKLARALTQSNRFDEAINEYRNALGE